IYYAHAGYTQRGPIQYPTLGALVAREAGVERADLPPFVSIAPVRRLGTAAHSSGFLGPRYAPLIVGNGPGPRVPNLAPHEGLAAGQVEDRLRLVRQMQDEFVAERPSAAASSHQTAYQRAVRLMRTAAARAFDLEREPAKLRDAYGRNPFGQGCLLARRLVERGVAFGGGALGGGGGFGGDTHAGNFQTVRDLGGVLGPAGGGVPDDLET